MSLPRSALALLAGLLIGAASMAVLKTGTTPAAEPPAAHAESGEAAATIWAISLVRARPGQRERLLRFLRANWLALDAQLLDQGRISHYRLLEADVGKGLDDSKAWDYAVILEYRDRQAMDAFVPAYLELIRTRPQVRIDGLVFADLGEVVQQKITQPLDVRLE